jgi:hypothetical protein
LKERAALQIASCQLWQLSQTVALERHSPIAKPWRRHLNATTPNQPLLDAIHLILRMETEIL